MTRTTPPREGDDNESTHGSVHDFDEIDRQILVALATDARNTSSPEIADKVDVTPATIRNRIETLVSRGVIEAHRSEIDYGRLGLLKFLFVCSVPPGRFDRITDQLAAFPEVIETRELLNGRHNFHVVAVVPTQEQAKSLERRLSHCGLEIDGIALIHNEHRTPSEVFGETEQSGSDTE